MGCWGKVLRLQPHLPMMFSCLSTFLLLIISLAINPSQKPLTLLYNKDIYSTCPVCAQCSIVPITSTSNDLIITYIDKTTINVKTLIKSIRSTGIRATIYVVTAEKSLSNELKDFFKNCSVNTFVAEGIDPNILQYTKIARLHAYKKFFQQINRVFYRVLHADPDEVYFQGDPFTKGIRAEGLKFIVEGYALTDANTSSSLQKCIDSNTYEKISSNTVISSSVFGGNQDEFMQVIDLMIETLNLSHDPSCYSSFPDQSIINYLMWTDQVDKLRIPIGFYPCSTQFVSFMNCIDTNNMMNEFSIITSKNGTEGIILDQYHRAGVKLEEICEVKET